MSEDATSHSQCNQTDDTPYTWLIKSDGGWRIGYGVSNFLIVEGSGWSILYGREILLHLKKNHPDGIKHKRRTSS